MSALATSPRHARAPDRTRIKPSVAPPKQNWSKPRPAVRQRNPDALLRALPVPPADRSKVPAPPPHCGHHVQSYEATLCSLSWTSLRCGKFSSEGSAPQWRTTMAVFHESQHFGFLRDNKMLLSAPYTRPVPKWEKSCNSLIPLRQLLSMSGGHC